MYVTLAINREALFKEQEIIEYVNELTALDEPPDGFYILIAARSQEARSEIYNADIISIWMYLNYALSINGFKVINGYSDLMAPFYLQLKGSEQLLAGGQTYAVFQLIDLNPRRVGVDCLFNGT